MKNVLDGVTFSRMKNRWDALIVALILTILFLACMCPFLLRLQPADICFVSFCGLIMLFTDAILLSCGFSNVTVHTDGITVSIGKLVLKRISADALQTVVKVRIDGRHPFVMLRALPISAVELEARGEAKLNRRPLVKNGLKFRRKKADWKDICIEAGLQKRGGLWMEFTPERQRLLQEMFPHAAHREAKKYNDPPSLV